MQTQILQTNSNPAVCLKFVANIFTVVLLLQTRHGAVCVNMNSSAFTFFYFNQG